VLSFIREDSKEYDETELKINPLKSSSRDLLDKTKELTQREAPLTSRRKTHSPV
jgi:hypothetical protein